MIIEGLIRIGITKCPVAVFLRRYDIQMIDKVFPYCERKLEIRATINRAIGPIKLFDTNRCMCVCACARVHRAYRLWERRIQESGPARIGRKRILNIVIVSSFFHSSSTNAQERFHTNLKIRTTV